MQKRTFAAREAVKSSPANNPPQVSQCRRRSSIPTPAIMMGKPVIAGTRITVELILEKLAAGESMEQVLQAHPRLTREAVLAALDYAVRVLRADVVYPAPNEAV